MPVLNTAVARMSKGNMLVVRCLAAAAATVPLCIGFTAWFGSFIRPGRQAKPFY